MSSNKKTYYSKYSACALKLKRLLGGAWKKPIRALLPLASLRSIAGLKAESIRPMYYADEPRICYSMLTKNLGTKQKPMRAKRIAFTRRQVVRLIPFKTPFRFVI